MIKKSDLSKNCRGAYIVYKKDRFKNFRNYKETNIELGEGFNVFMAGMHKERQILSNRSIWRLPENLHELKDMELIRWNSEDARIRIDYEEKKKRIEIYLNKRIKANKKERVRISKIGELMNLNTVIFSPDS